MVTLSNKPVLMFHEIICQSDDYTGWHLESNGKYSVSYKNFIEFLDSFGDHFVYTFDDGGISNIIAARELKKRNLRGIFFIPSGYIGKDGFLNKEQVIKLSVNHDVYSHSHNHRMKRCNENEYYTDYSKSIEIIGKLITKPITEICLPGGTITPNHLPVFKTLQLKKIYHSASTNILLKLFFGNTEFTFVPRIIMDDLIVTNSIRAKKIKPNYLYNLKSHFKQIIYLLL